MARGGIPERPFKNNLELHLVGETWAREGVASTCSPGKDCAPSRSALSLERAEEPFSTARSSRRGDAERLEPGVDAAADELLPDGFEFLTSFRVGSSTTCADRSSRQDVRATARVGQAPGRAGMCLH